MEDLTISIDPERCSGHGRCYGLAPELVDSDDRGYGVVMAPTVPEGLEHQAEQAQRNCPERAVVLRRGIEAASRQW